MKNSAVYKSEGENYSFQIKKLALYISERVFKKTKIFGCQNLKNYSLYNGEEEFEKYLAQKRKKSSLYSGRGIILNFFLKRVVKMPEKRRLDEGIKNFGLSKSKKTHY